MIIMFCDNCGAKIDEREEYCPNCGMQLIDLPPNQRKKKKYDKNPGSFHRTESRSVDKPIKQRYIEKSAPESYDYPQYFDDEEYEEEYEYPDPDYYQEGHEEKSGMGIGSIILILFIALILGFIVGMLLFGSQSVPQIPGFNT